MLRVEFTVLSRQELFDLVWATPMQILARRFGITDVALKKRCKKHGVPTPGVGYWARVAAGQKLKRPALPKPPGPHLDRIVFKPSLPAKLPVPKEEVPTISVPTKLVEPHEATLWAEERLKEANTDAYGRLLVGSTYFPELCMRQETVKRALLLLDTVAKALVELGIEVVVAPYHPTSSPTILVQGRGERLGLRVEERLAKRPHVVTPAEQKSAAQLWGRKPQKWDYVPDGRLSIRLDHTHHLFRGHARWTETKATPFEQQLGKIAVGIETALAAHRDARAEEDRQKAQQLADERARVRPERLRWYQGWMARDVEAHAATWARARELRGFLEAYETAKKPSGPAMEWLVAAHHYLERLDPLTSGATVEKELEPADEVLEKLNAQERAREKGA